MSEPRATGGGAASPAVAASLALLFPGAGHLYAGRPGRAFAVATLTAAALLPAALAVWSAPVERLGALRAPAALLVLSLPALDAARIARSRDAARAARSGTRTRGARALALGLGLVVANALLGLVAFVLVTSLWLAAMELDRESMRPNLLPGDVLLVDHRAATAASAAPGDLVVFEHPAGSGRLHVKRLAADEGQDVAVREGILVVDGVPRGVAAASGTAVEESRGHRYRVEAGDGIRADFGPLRVPAGEFFALGDDRPVSRDSRAFGPVPRSLLRGRPLRVLWSREPGGRLRFDRTGLDAEAAR